MKKAALIALVGILAILFADCFYSYPRFGPPPLRAEAVIGVGRPGYVWIGGNWGWGGGGYHWHSGHWARARHGRHWTDGRWEQRGSRWTWRRGYWR